MISPSDRLPLVVSSVVPRPVLQRISDVLDDGARQVARDAGLTTERVDELVTAWSSECPFVVAAIDLVRTYLEPVVREHTSTGDRPTTLVGATLFTSSGAHRAPTHAHQDLAYRWKPTAQRYAWSTWLAIDPATLDSGALRFCQSMPANRVHMRQDHLDAEFEDQSLTDSWISHEHVATVNQGDVLLFSSMAWHASTRCRSGVRRRALAMRWRSATRWEDDVCIPEPPNTPTRFGMDTSGRHFCDAVMRAFPEVDGHVPEHTPFHHAQWLLAQHGMRERMGPPPWKAIVDLADALRLAKNYGARPGAFVWTAVRDDVLPVLRALNEQVVS